MTSPALRELVYILRHEEPSEALRVVLHESPAVAQDLGLAAEDIRSIVELEDEELRHHIERLLRRRYVELDQARRAAARHMALDAAERLAATARDDDGNIELEVGVLLGPLTADRTMKYIGFDLGEHELCVPRSTLVAVRKNVRFPDLRARLDAEALRFRWRGGRGGLNLWGHDVRPCERDALLRVVLHRPVATVEPAEIGERARPQPRRGGAWLGEILAEIGFSI